MLVMRAFEKVSEPANGLLLSWSSTRRPQAPPKISRRLTGHAAPKIAADASASEKQARRRAQLRVSGAN